LVLAALAAGCVGTDGDVSGFDDSLDVLGSGGATPGKDPVETDARIWNNSMTLYRCGTWRLSEDFSSGRYNVHRFRTSLPAGGVVHVALYRHAGEWSPAVVAFDVNGDSVYEGAFAGAHPQVTSLPVSTGAEGSVAAVDLEASSPTEVDVYVTSWQVLASGFDASMPRDVRYELSMVHDCGGAVSTDLDDVHAGIDMAGVPIPRAGVSNSTLRRVVGVSVEPYGAVVSHDGREFVSGRTSWFGGPNDRGVGSSETGAITGERLRSLNTPANPSEVDLTSRPEDFYFIAMRFDYGPAGIEFWRDARLLVVNPSTGASVVVRPVDWGPSTSTRRVLDLSPQAMADLGLVTDDTALVAFAISDAPLGRSR
jgi:hypothetical protein